MKIGTTALYAAVACVGIMIPTVASAYIGPGAGLSAIGTAIAVIGAFLLLIVGFVWYPVKRLLRGRKKASDPTTGKGASNTAE